jgi:acyl-CoA thioesterase I
MRSWWKFFRVARRFAPLVVVVSWAKPADAAKIACVGDSITYGYNLSNPSQQSWPAVLQTMLGSGHTVQNFGSSGCTLLKLGDKPYWNDPAFSASDAFKPDVVVVMLGTNDAKPQNWSHKADFVGDYTSLIGHYRTPGALVYVVLPPPVYAPGAFSIDPNVLSGEVVPLIRQIAANANVPLIDVFQALSGLPSDFPDTVHPNVDGSKLIAQTVAAALQEGGFGGAAGSTGVGVGGASTGTGGTSGVGGSTKSAGGTSTGTGGTSSVGGSTKATGGASTGTGGTSGVGGSAKSTGGASTSNGGTSGVGGSTKSTGGASTSTGGSFGSGGVTGTGATSMATGGGFNSAGGATTGGTSTAVNSGSSVGGNSVTGGSQAGSSNATPAGSTAMGGNPVGSSEPTANQPANASGCGCRTVGGCPAHRSEFLVTMLLLTLLKRTRRGVSASG